MLNNFAFVRCINNDLVLFDKRNDQKIIGDYNSYLFLKKLSYVPQNIDVIVKNICKEFIDVPDWEIIKNDVENLFNQLAESSFIAKGTTSDECKANATKFSYSDLNVSAFTFSKTETDELIKFRDNCSETPALQQVIIEITKFCNERCLHCYIPHENKNIEMSSDDFYKVIDEIAELQTVFEIKISGGECMTHPCFKDFIKYVKEKGFALSLLTNLTLLDDEILDILRTGTLSSVQVTLFAVNPEIHDKIAAVPGYFEKVLKNLEKLHDADIPVSIATQVMELNKDEIENLYLFANSHNFRLLCDRTIIAKENQDIGNLDLRVNDVSCYNKICNLRIKYDKNFRTEFLAELQSPLRLPSSFLCNAGMNMFQIGVDMNVHPCSGWSIILGNLKNSSVKDIWETSHVLKKIRQANISNFPKCVNCRNSNICHLCMAQAYNEGNTDFKFEMSNYICEMYNEIRKAVENYSE